MKQHTPQQKIERARMRLVTDFPFFGSVFFRLNVHEDPDCSTAWTDGESMGYNPEWLGKWSIEQIVGVFTHEILHVVCKHHLREELSPIYKDKHRKCNVAMDYAINPVVETTAGMALPDNCLIDMQKWPDELWEDIFNQLPDQPPCPVCNDTGTGPNGESCPCSDGMIGEVRPYKQGKASKAQKDQAANEVDQWVTAAGLKAKNAGRLTGGQEAMIKKILTPTVYWQDELQFICEDITRDDYTWTRPNTRYMGAGCYLPSMHGTRSVDMLFFVDTSGSLDDTMLAQIMAEVRNIIEHFNIRVIVVYWDTKYKGHEIFDPEEVADPSWGLTAKGRGGTSFGDVLDWMDSELDELEVVPEAVIFFSDLECSNYPKDEPELPWLWCQVPDGGRFNDNYLHHLPDWGRHVRIPIGS